MNNQLVARIKFKLKDLDSKDLQSLVMNAKANVRKIADGESKKLLRKKFVLLTNCFS